MTLFSKRMLDAIIVSGSGAFSLPAVSPLPYLSWLLHWSIAAGCLLMIHHYALPAAKVRASALRRQRSVVIVGAPDACHSLIARARFARRTVFRWVCVWNPDSTDRIAVAGVPACPDLDALTLIVRQRLVDEIWLAMPLLAEQTLRQIVHHFRHDFVDIRYLPTNLAMSLPSNLPSSVPAPPSGWAFGRVISDLLDTPAIDLSITSAGHAALLPKFIFDRLFAAAALCMLSPLLIGIAIAVKCSSPGPILFRQTRMGANGKVFSILKFRSMRTHASAPGALKQASRGDPRITRVGAILRRTSLDELPQFFNVLRGDMSVVGPRPHALEHDDLYKEFIDGYMYRYRMKPGITGLAQINGFRGETATSDLMQTRVYLDLHYMRHWSVWLDARIILGTIFVVLIGKNAH